MSSTNQLQLKFPTDDDDPQWLKDISSILSSFLLTTSSSPQRAAQDLTALLPISETDPESFLWNFWSVLTEIISQIPANHPCHPLLISLILAIRDLPNPKEVELENWGTYRFWSDVPLFGPVIVEKLNSTENVATLVSLNSFAAQLTVASATPPAKKFDFSIWSLYFLRPALEDEPDPRAKAYLKQGPELDKTIPPAAEWVKQAASAIYERSQRAESPEDDPTQHGGKNWKGAPGFNLPRWEFWKKRFGEIADRDQGSDETRSLAAQAKGWMEEAEKQD